MTSHVRTRTICLMITAVAAAVAALSAQVRDASPAAAVLGTAAITGTVVTDDAQPVPLRRAIVTVSGGELLASRSAITDDDGRYAIRNLPAGRFSITATKHGYVSSAFGATRPGRPGTTAAVTAGQSFDATIRMAPAGVMTGVIRDELGQPIAGLRVFALDANEPAAPVPVARNSATGVGVETDDRGVFRIYDLVPSEYIIAAVPTFSINGDMTRRTTTEMDRVLSQLASRATMPGTSPAALIPPSQGAATIAAVYFPGTANLADATHVKIGRGDVRDGLDFVMRVVPVTTIEGVIMNAEGPLPSSIEMTIVPGNTLSFFALSSANPSLSRRPDADGRFLYTTIVPGHYKIMARAGRPADSGPFGRGGGATSGSTMSGADRAATGTAGTLFAVEEVDVTGQPVTGVTLRLQPGSKVDGRLVVDSATQPESAKLSAIRLNLTPARGTGYSVVGGTQVGNAFSGALAMLQADGTFEFLGVAPGSYKLTSVVPASIGPGFWLRSAMLGGKDILDSMLDVSLGTDLSNVVLTLTDKHSELSGTLQTANGLPAPDYFVIVMPAEATLRVTGSRRVKSTRPGTDGRFRFADLPAGDYLLIALTDVAPDEWQRPEFLANIASAGVRVSLADGERKTQDLQIAR
jgi:Carboxypeptidase regulatory-like domain